MQTSGLVKLLMPAGQGYLRLSSDAGHHLRNPVAPRFGGAMPPSGGPLSGMHPGDQSEDRNDVAHIVVPPTFLALADEAINTRPVTGLMAAPSDMANLQGDVRL